MRNHAFNNGGPRLARPIRWRLKLAWVVTAGVAGTVPAQLIPWDNPGWILRAGCIMAGGLIVSAMYRAVLFALDRVLDIPG